MALRPPWEQAFFHWLEESVSRLFTDDWAGLRVVLTISAALFLIVVAIAIHEVGHLLAGLAAGFHFRSLSVGRWQIDRNLKVSRQGPGEDAALGGAFFAPNEMRNHPQGIAFMTLAGPMANLISAFILMMLPFHKSLIVGWFIAVSLFLGIENLVPFQYRGVTSDGMNLFTLLWNRAKYERRLALLQLLQDRLEGVETESISPELLATATAVRDKSSETFWAHLIAYAAAYTQKKDDEAARLLEVCLQYLGYAPSSLREIAIANAGIFQADRRKRIDLARQWLGDLPQNLKVPHRRLMVEGAILEAQQDFLGALQKVSEIEKAISSNLDLKRQQAALKPFAKWRAELEQKAAPSTAEPAPNV